MKRAGFTIAILFCAGFFMIGADFRGPKVVEEQAIIKKHCSGYTILEAGKGIDCNGDTVALVKKYGYYELASSYKTDNTLSAVN